jgi:hypothetical protein
MEHREGTRCVQLESEFDVTHAFTTNDRASDFNSTFFTDNILVANTSVFSTVTFVIFFWTEDSFVERDHRVLSVQYGS